MSFGRFYLGISCLETPGHVLTWLQTFCQRDRGVLTPEWDISNLISSQSTQKQCHIWLVNRLYKLNLSLVIPIGSHDLPCEFMCFRGCLFKDLHESQEQNGSYFVFKMPEVLTKTFSFCCILFLVRNVIPPLTPFYLVFVSLSGKQHISSIQHRSVKLSMQERARDRTHLSLELHCWEHHLYQKHCIKL